jgi:hypothetical protein
MGPGNRSMAPVYKIRVGPKSAEKVAEHSLCDDRLTGACCVRGRHLRAEGVLINRTDQNLLRRRIFSRKPAINKLSLLLFCLPVAKSGRTDLSWAS